MNFDARDVILSLKYGDRYTLNGRLYTHASGCVSHYATGWSQIPAFNTDGKLTRVKVKANSTVDTHQEENWKVAR